MMVEIEKMKSRGWRIEGSREPKKRVCRLGCFKIPVCCQAFRVKGLRLPGLEAFITVCCQMLGNPDTWVGLEDAVPLDAKDKGILTSCTYTRAGTLVQ